MMPVTAKRMRMAIAEMMLNVVTKLESEVSGGGSVVVVSAVKGSIYIIINPYKNLCMHVN